MSWQIGMHPPPLVSLDQATVQSFANQKLNRLGQRQPDSELVLQREEVNEGEITLDVYALTEDKIPWNEGAEREVAGMRPDWLPG